MLPKHWRCKGDKAIYWLPKHFSGLWLQREANATEMNVSYGDNSHISEPRFWSQTYCRFLGLQDKCLKCHTPHVMMNIKDYRHMKSKMCMKFKMNVNTLFSYFLSSTAYHICSFLFVVFICLYFTFVCCYFTFVSMLLYDRGWKWSL